MEEILFSFVGIILLFLTPIVFYYIFRSKVYNYHSHWDIPLDDFSFSSKEFYQLLRTELSKNGIHNVQYERVHLREGNIFSSRRLYLRIRWKEYHFDVCAAPFGNGFFISWWLLYNYSIFELIVLLIPFIGRWLHRKLFTVTYYKIDTATMFMKFTHLSVLNVLDELTISEGARFLEEDERKPIHNDIFKR